MRQFERSGGGTLSRFSGDRYSGGGGGRGQWGIVPWTSIDGQMKGAKKASTGRRKRGKRPKEGGGGKVHIRVKRSGPGHRTKKGGGKERKLALRTTRLPSL